MADDFSNAPVEQWALDKLVPYEKNHKKHPTEHVKALAASITEFGLEHPIAIEEDGTIISGHGRRLALIELDRKFASVRVFRGITKEQANKLRIAANKTTSNDYDTDVLAAELRNILDSGMTLDGLGLTDKETTILLEDIGELDLDAMSDEIVSDVDRHEERATTPNEFTGLVPTGKAFGFNKVEAPVARLIGEFFGKIETATGKKGIEALCDHMLAVVDAGR